MELYAVEEYLNEQKSFKTNDIKFNACQIDIDLDLIDFFFLV